MEWTLNKYFSLKHKHAVFVVIFVDFLDSSRRAVLVGVACGIASLPCRAAPTSARQAAIHVAVAPAEVSTNFGRKSEHLLINVTDDWVSMVGVVQVPLLRSTRRLLTSYATQDERQRQVAELSFREVSHCFPSHHSIHYIHMPQQIC